jgi:hypothetical protein
MTRWIEFHLVFGVGALDFLLDQRNPKHLAEERQVELRGYR